MNDSSPCQANEPFRVRSIARDEMRLFFEWANGEGWNPGRFDGPCFHDADPGGMLVAELQGEPVASISCVRYPDNFGFVGHYIVRPEFRGRGLGLRLWTAGLARLAGCNVGLDGVLDQVANYERSGFRTSHHHVRYGGSVGGAPVVIPPALKQVPLDAVPFADVLAYDRECFPVDRAVFLRGWVAQPESVALGVLRGGALAGFGIARAAVSGHKIGPLFADDVQVAEVLLLGLAKEVGGPVVIDVPDTSVQAYAEPLVQGLGMTEVFRCARMYTRGRPAMADHKVFGNTSLELG
ncbi:Acetyltransferase (GNAT) family protein [Gemmata sp. SH-PL17]|uniref:GNAT family N-acetyltransferase n=1 Tax=Gemmata sp. SH-PL17 TaxID=1630693 RepID=UPI0004B9C15B|nr:GNAT family N-acetyltransferase [Gemmata sp. SH-PL17]AMV24384.1 Acetyltransferase (GNAT) family protein [Gemmata sp. SH-PL17]